MMKSLPFLFCESVVIFIPNFQRDIKVKEFDITNDYEMQALHDCIYPRAKATVDRAGNFGSLNRLSHYVYSLPVYLCLVEAMFRKHDIKHQMIDCGRIGQAKTPDDLKGLNRALVQASHLQMLTIGGENMPQKEEDNPFSWNGGEGLAALKPGLVKAPKLRMLCFNMIFHQIDEKNAKAIADIIIARQRNKKVKPFEEIHFGDHCVTPEAVWKLLEALRNYPVPIVIYYSIPQAGVSPLDNPLGDKDLGAISKKVNFRWGTGRPFNTKEVEKMEWAFFWKDNNIACLRIEEVKDHEARRNK